MRVGIGVGLFSMSLLFTAFVVGASSHNTDFSDAQGLQDGVSYRGTVDSTDLYFSINPQLDTKIEFEMIDVQGQYLEFCLYHGTSSSDRIDCFGYETRPSTFVHTETAVKDTYYLTVSCSECNLEGVDDVEFLLLADYTPHASQSESNLLLTFSFILAGAIVYLMFSRRNNPTPQKPLQRPVQSYNQTSNSKQIVQNITYNIQDSVISGDLDTSLSKEDNDP